MLHTHSNNPIFFRRESRRNPCEIELPWIQYFNFDTAMTQDRIHSIKGGYLQVYKVVLGLDLKEVLGLLRGYWQGVLRGMDSSSTGGTSADAEGDGRWPCFKENDMAQWQYVKGNKDSGEGFCKGLEIKRASQHVPIRISYRIATQEKKIKN